MSDLKKRSRTFRDWWKEHNVAWPHSWRRELRLLGGIKVANTIDLAFVRPMRLFSSAILRLRSEAFREYVLPICFVSTSAT